MSFVRTTLEFIADLLDRVREPGWVRTIATIVIIVLIMLIPYPLSVTGDFKMVSTNPITARTMISGIVTEVLVEMDEEVEVGQVVVRLMDVEKRHELAKLDAELAEADALWRMKKNGYRKEDIKIAQLKVRELGAVTKLARTNLKRQKTLLAEEAISQAEFDLARSERLQARQLQNQAREELERLSNGYRVEDVEQAAAKVLQLKAKREEIVQHIEWTEVRSPKTGRVVTSNTELRELMGQYVERGTPLIAMIAPNELVARISIEENDFGDIELEQEVLLRPYQFPSLRFSGKVDVIQPFVVSDEEFSSTVSILTRSDDSDWNRLPVNATGKAKVSLGTRPFGLVIYRRVVRSLWVQAWSWY